MKKTPQKVRSKIKKAQKKLVKKSNQFQVIAKKKIKVASQVAGKELEKAKDEFEQIEEKVREYVKKNPEKFVVAATGIGAFIGALTATLLQGKKNKKK